MLLQVDTQFRHLLHHSGQVGCNFCTPPVPMNDLSPAADPSCRQPDSGLSLAACSWQPAQLPCNSFKGCHKAFICSALLQDSPEAEAQFWHRLFLGHVRQCLLPSSRGERVAYKLNLQPFQHCQHPLHTCTVFNLLQVVEA